MRYRGLWAEMSGAWSSSSTASSSQWSLLLRAGPGHFTSDQRWHPSCRSCPVPAVSPCRTDNSELVERSCTWLFRAIRELWLQSSDRSGCHLGTDALKDHSLPADGSEQG